MSTVQGDYRRWGFNARIGKIPWRRKWQPTLLFLLGNSTDRGAWQATGHGVAKELDTAKQLNNKRKLYRHISLSFLLLLFYFFFLIRALKRLLCQWGGKVTSVQFSHSVVSDSLWPTPWTTTQQASLSITNSQSPPKPVSIESVMLSSHLILCHPLLPLPSIFPSISVFSNESILHVRWPKYWSFSFNISSSNEHPGLISSRMDWLDLLAVQGTLNSLHQYHSSKASILQCSAFIIVRLSHPWPLGKP